MKYIFKQIDIYTPSEITMEFNADTLPAILEQFEMFLRGSGFFFDGNVDIIEEESYKEDPWIANVDLGNDVMSWTANQLQKNKYSIYEDGYESPSAGANNAN